MTPESNKFLPNKPASYASFNACSKASNGSW